MGRRKKFVKRRPQDLGDFCFRFFITAILILTYATNPKAIAQFIDVADIEAEISAGVGRTANVPDDCVLDGPINCRDPDIHALLMTAAINRFKDIHIYKFGKPVPGENDTSCHMAWRFGPKHDKDTDKEEDGPSLYKDYRSFAVVKNENCSLEVVSIGDYHSGGNARKRKNKEEARDAVDDFLPVIKTEESFIRDKYLVYYGGGDRCKSMNHYLWSFSCMLGEARYLNRTLVMDTSICLSKMYTSSKVDEEGKDFMFYFDFEHLTRSLPVVDQNLFWLEWGKWGERNGLTLHLVEDFRVPPMKLADVKESVIMRKFGSVEPDNYWYRVCEDESVIQRPWHMIRRSRRLVAMASAIAARMEFDFDAIHVKRSGKSQSCGLVEEDLGGKIEQGRKVYVAATKEETCLALVDELKRKYAAHVIEDFKDLWDSRSDWAEEMKKLNNGIAVEFDGYMRDSVDREVFMMGKKTFSDL